MVIFQQIQKKKMYNSIIIIQFRLLRIHHHSNAVPKFFYDLSSKKT